MARAPTVFVKRFIQRKHPAAQLRAKVASVFINCIWGARSGWAGLANIKYCLVHLLRNRGPCVSLPAGPTSMRSLPNLTPTETMSDAKKNVFFILCDKTVFFLQHDFFFIVQEKNYCAKKILWEVKKNYNLMPRKKILVPRKKNKFKKSCGTKQIFCHYIKKTFSWHQKTCLWVHRPCVLRIA